MVILAQYHFLYLCKEYLTFVNFKTHLTADEVANILIYPLR